MLSKVDYQARGVLYIPAEARRDRLTELPQGANIRKSINDAMRLIEDENANLQRTRDLLLPRLVSGEVDVSEVEIAI